jgi:predicted nucleotidyltransferase
LLLLNSGGVEYLIVGGYAVSFHGYPRTTADLDLWVSTAPANAARLSSALLAFGFPSAAVQSVDLTQPDRVIRMGNPPLRIEILTGVSGLRFDAAYARRVQAVIDGAPVNVIALEDLKTNKRAAGRPRDLNDLEKLG